MADTADLVDRLSFLGGNEEARADVPDATSAVPDGDEEAQTLADLQAELAGQDPPQGDPTDPEAEPDPTAALTPEQVAAILAENEAFKAAQAQAEAEQVDAAFESRWESHWERGIGWYEDQKARIQQAGVAQQRSQEEIDAAIYRRVVLGHGLIDPNSGAPVMGQQQWERETAANEADEVAAYYRGKSAPSAVDTLTQRYALDDTDRNTLARFINYPPEHLEAIAQALGGKNQRQTLTHQQITTQAAANVNARLTRLPAPGTPGAARPKKPYQWGSNPREETELVASRVMGW